MNLNQKRVLLPLGIVAGLGAVLLAIFGNPGNMAFCIACFLRDSAGAMKFHTAEVVQYFRPEVVGIVLGSFVVALIKREFKPYGGSAPVIRFLLGAAMMIGALVFLGCPLRMILRMAAGDVSAYIGLIGFAGGVLTGSAFIKKGYSLGEPAPVSKAEGSAFPIVVAVLMAVSVTTGLFAVSEKGPGSMHAPVLISLAVGLLFGVIAQRTRMCFGGAIRNIFLMKNFNLLCAIGGVFISMLVYNVATARFTFVAYGPIAHAQHLWNILGLYVVGFAAVLLGGCPLRQLVLAGSGSSDSVVTVLGLFFGSAVCHNFGLAAAPAAAATAEKAAVAGGPGLGGKVAVIACLVLLFVVAVVGTRRAAAAAGAKAPADEAAAGDIPAA